MATIPILEAKGDLLPYEPDFEHDEFPSRWIHQAPDFPAWLGKLQEEEPDQPRNLSPFEQVEQLLFDYAVGRPMIYARDRRLLEPVGFHVWEMKTLDVRLFGWLPMRRHLVLVCGEMKRHLKPSSRYKPFVDRVVAFRDKLDLDRPKFLMGVQANDIC
ncbi:MAG: hypothetical protein KIT25_07025 [Enhydrobacter sp.]|nr:MAG: hypothetical protein KIT25_07025 [Enhydrobacter sp.]